MAVLREADGFRRLANVLEGGVEAIFGRVSAVSLGRFSGAAGTAGSSPASRRAVSLVLLIGVRVCHRRRARRNQPGHRAVNSSARLARGFGPAAPVLPRRRELAVGVFAVGDRRRLRLLDGKPAIDRGILADLLDAAASGGRSQAVVVRSDRRGDLTQGERRVAKSVSRSSFARRRRRAGGPPGIARGPEHIA